MTEKFTLPTDVEETVHVKPTGNPTTDTANLKAAIAQIHANPCGMIKLVETGQTLAINEEVYFTKQDPPPPAEVAPFTTTSLVGSNHSTITLIGAGHLVFGRYFNPTGVGTAVLGSPPLAENSNVIVLPGGVSPMKDDIVLIWADDNLNSKVVPHGFSDPSSENRPGEVFRVIEVNGGNAYFDTRAIDLMSTNCKIYLIQDYKRVRIENFELLGDETNSNAGISLYSLADSQIQGIKINGGGQISVNYCDTIRIDDCQIVRVRMPTPGSAYGIVLGINNNVLITGCTFGFCRHPVTTGGWDSGIHRYGMGKGYRVTNCTIKGAGEGVLVPNQSMTLFDTHAESYGMTYDNNQVFGGRHAGETNLIAFNMRGRASTIRNNYIRLDAALDSRGVNIVAPDCVVVGNVIEDCVWPVSINNQDVTPSAHTNRIVVKDNVFRRNFAGMVIRGGSGLQIEGNQFFNQTAHTNKIEFTSLAGTSLILGGSTVADRNIIRDNNLDKNSNANSILAITGAAVGNLGIYNNQMRGYGAASIGVASPETAAYNTAYAAKNITDP